MKMLSAPRNIHFIVVLFMAVPRAALASTASYLVSSRDLAKSPARLFSGYCPAPGPHSKDLTRRANHRHRCIVTRFSPHRETGRGLFYFHFPRSGGGDRRAQESRSASGKAPSRRAAVRTITFMVRDAT